MSWYNDPLDPRPLAYTDVGDPAAPHHGVGPPRRQGRRLVKVQPVQTQGVHDQPPVTGPPPHPPPPPLHHHRRPLLGGPPPRLQLLPGALAEEHVLASQDNLPGGRVRPSSHLPLTCTLHTADQSTGPAVLPPAGHTAQPSRYQDDR